MTIISVTWTIYDKRIKAFMNNCTGGGLVIKNICEYIGRQEKSYLFLGNTLLPETQLDHFTVLGTLGDDAPDRSDNEKYLKYLACQFEKHVIKLKPDIVNFHGIGDFINLCVVVCDKLNIPYVATNHLYIGNNITYGGYERCRVWEEKLYLHPDIQVTAVSTGIKKRMEQDYPNLKNIKVILNGTDFMSNMESEEVQLDQHIQGKKILVCVGTISERKNQIQVIDAFEHLRNSIQENLVVLFFGNENSRMKGKLQKKIEEKELHNKVFYCGALTSKQMKTIYSIADGLIMPSKAEGLSIAVLEAIAYGLPIIMFSDSECAYDLNDKNVVCFAEDRSDESLANAIQKWFDSKWEYEYIKEYSQQFTLEQMSNKYIEFYNEILLKRSSPKSNK